MNIQCFVTYITEWFFDQVNPLLYVFWVAAAGKKFTSFWFSAEKCPKTSSNFPRSGKRELNKTNETKNKVSSKCWSFLNAGLEELMLISLLMMVGTAHFCSLCNISVQSRSGLWLFQSKNKNNRKRWSIFFFNNSVVEWHVCWGAAVLLHDPRSREIWMSWHFLFKFAGRNSKLIAPSMMLHHPGQDAVKRVQTTFQRLCWNSSIQTSSAFKWKSSILASSFHKPLFKERSSLPTKHLADFRLRAVTFPWSPVMHYCLESSWR